MFFGPIGKTRWPPWPLIGWDILDFSSETAERNYTKLDRKQDLNVLYKVCVFRADRKNKMAALASDWLRHFWLLLWNRWTELHEIWQEARSQRPLPSLCFRADRKNKMAALASHWLRHFRLLLWNCWTEFNETWQEARSQPPLPSLCFSGGSEKQDGRPYLWLAETFSTFSLKSLNGIQGNLTRRKISTSSTKFVFFGRIGKTKWPLWPLIGWDIFDFSSETAEQNSTKLWQEERSKRPLPSLCWDLLMLQLLRPNSSNLPCLYSTFHLEYPLVLSRFCFFDRSEKQDGCPGQSV